jgi:CRP-like cAMP-binding protein
MVSSDIIRGYVEFGTLNESQLKSIAAITSEVKLKPGDIIFHEGKPASALYLLTAGKVELYYVVEETIFNVSKEFGVGEIKPGELFGLSALFEPYRYETTAKVIHEGVMLCIDGLDLRKLMEKDKDLALLLMQQMVRILNHKLQTTRAELASTRTVA